MRHISLRSKTQIIYKITPQDVHQSLILYLKIFFKAINIKHLYIDLEHKCMVGKKVK